MNFLKKRDEAAAKAYQLQVGDLEDALEEEIERGEKVCAQTLLNLFDLGLIKVLNREGNGVTKPHTQSQNFGGNNPFFGLYKSVNN